MRIKPETFFYYTSMKITFSQTNISYYVSYVPIPYTRKIVIMVPISSIKGIFISIKNSQKTISSVLEFNACLKTHPKAYRIIENRSPHDVTQITMFYKSYIIDLNTILDHHHLLFLHLITL